MDPISYGVAAKQKQRIEKVIAEPDSTSGVITVPQVIAAGETITVPAGRTAVLPNVQVDGTLNVQGDVFIPSGATMSKVVEKVVSTDNAIVRFNGATGDVQNSGVIIDDNNNVTQNGTSSSQFSLKVGGSLKGWLYSGTSGTALASADYLTFNTNNNEKMRIDTAGNVGIGVTPSAWFSSYKAIETIGGSIFNSSTDNIRILQNVYQDSDWKYKNNGYASRYDQQAGQHTWLVAPSGTAGNAITWATAMELSPGKTLSLFGSTNASDYIQLSLKKSNGSDNATFYGIDGIANTAIWVGMSIGKYSINNRSINATGTVNASGADYAEYEKNNGITFSKGQIVGFKADGTLTDKYSESIRFAIKSTNPSYVGGDTWGNEEVIGKRPEQPIKKEEQTNEDFTAIEEQYKVELAAFETRLEAERQKVDRIAYSGKVPVNVVGATAGQYVCVKNDEGTIGFELITSPNFEQYLTCVGRVNKILEDGRAEVAVIIH